VAVSDAFAAAMRLDRGMPPRRAAATAGKPAERAPKKSSQKIQKSSKSLLTVRGTPDYIRLTNDGGDAAGDKEVRF
jgi:hypothetical protein